MLSTTRFSRPLAVPLLLALALSLGACVRKDPVAADLLSLNAASRSATQDAQLQNAMGRVQQAKTKEEKAAILRESAKGLSKVQTTLQRVDLRTPEVKDIQTRLAGAFGQVAGAAQQAATAFENSDSAALAQASQAMQDTQQEIASVGQDFGRLAQEHKVDLGKQP